MNKTIRLHHSPISGLIPALALAWLCISPAQAQSSDRVMGLQPKVKELSTFSKPYGATVQSGITISALKLPMPVLAVDGDFLKVKLDGKEVWIDGADVIVEKPVPYECVAAAKPKPGKVAATQGASSGCK